MQGLSPTVMAAFSDKAGRRQAYILCFIIFLCANVGLALQTNYAALMVLRCLQSAGSSGTVALSSAVVADISTSAERGVFMGMTFLGGILGLSLAPIIGGLISQFLNWHWIFWFLLIFGAVFFIPYLLFFPETCRYVVGNGSKRPPLLNMTLIDIFLEKRRSRNSNISEPPRQRQQFHFPNPLGSLYIVADKESAFILVLNGLIVACMYTFLAGIPSQFASIYGFNDIKIALVYVPFSGGGVLSAFTTGKTIDWNYRRHAKRLGVSIVSNRQQDISDFPIETARIQVSLPILYLSVACMIGCAWVLDAQLNLAGPLILLFVVGYGFVATNQVLNTLMVDLYPGQTATAMAANNLVRCLMGAAATAVLNPLFEAIGIGWTYTFFALLWAICSPFLFLLMRYGPTWRRERREKERAKEERRKDKAAKMEEGQLKESQGTAEEKQNENDNENDESRGIESNTNSTEEMSENRE